MHNSLERATMIEYKNDLRMRVSIGKGIVGVADLTPTPGYESALDKEIIACAAKNLKGQALITFFWAYHCEESWDAIRSKFKDHLNKQLAVDTLQRYARNAANRIVDRLTQN